MNYLLVFIGGGLGSIARMLFSKVFPTQPGAFPLSTFLSNSVSSTILGITLGLVFYKHISNDNLKFFIVTGFCGGFSTFSTFSYETYFLATTGHLQAAMLNMFLNIIVCYLAVMAGFYLTRFV